MAKIRRKTIDSAAKDYLNYAREQGIDLSWNNYERMLPQDGFARLGLSCADCLMGPCRISPFAREEAKTVCGMDTNDLVYRSVMRLLGVTPGHTKDYIGNILKAAKNSIAAPSNPRDGQTSIGIGVLDKNMINICVEGVPFSRLEEIEAAAAGMGDIAVSVGAKGFKFSLVGHACSKRCTVGGNADIEFAILSGLVDAYLLGPTAVGIGKNAAAHYHTAVICQSLAAPEILIEAAAAFAKRADAKIRPDESIATAVLNSYEKLEKIASGYDRIAVFAGGENIKLTTGELTVELIKRLSGSGVACFTFGNSVITAEKAGLHEHVYACGGEACDMVGYSAIRSKICVVCMPELDCGTSVSRAIYIGDNGLNVITATELPVGGSSKISNEIQKRVKYCAPGEYVTKVLEAAI